MDEATGGKNYDGFSDEEREAMKERAKELKAEARRGEGDAKAREKGEADVREKIAEMPERDRVIAERLHALVAENAPELMPKTWYGMPAYAKNGEIVCFFQSADKFKGRYSTFGFNDPANLDEGNMWATSFAVTRLTAADEKKIAALVKKAVS
jgi:uncharacterized protein YdhG (YjbR/CyaY superfamily)